MSEPLDVLILNALLEHLTTPNIYTPSIETAFPGVPFTPTPGVSYLHAHAPMRANPVVAGLGFDSSIINRGIFQVDAVAPDNAGGIAPGLRLAALIVARFDLGTALVAGSHKLQVLSKPTIADAVRDAPWVRFPVSIPYFIVT